LEGIYRPRGFAPLWLAGARPTGPAREAVALLSAADERGLDPRDYGAERLAAELRALEAGREASPEALALLDTALTMALLRELSDLDVGRVKPGEVRFRLAREPAPRDLAALVTAAVREDRVAGLAAAVEPGFEAYRRLLRALAEYRALARDPSVVPVEVEPTLRPGDPFEAAPALARYLVALRDLPAGAGVPSPRYEGQLVEAVRRFQRRHGLAADGEIGPETARALAVEPARRARQIELALERFRWIPEVGPRRTVFVNLPAFELVALEGLPDGAAVATRVAVGRAARTPTPVFAAEMRRLVFRPYWNVPRSIAVNEILPQLRRRPGYLAEHEMEIVSREGGTVLPPTRESVEALAAGTARLRQRPGPRNALGGVKFDLPNPYGVYLHDTPGQEVFERSRRDFSHGCVRVEDALGLAAWALRDQPEWDEARIRAEMQGAHDRAVPLREPILVLVFYATAIARADGSVSFYEDLYGHDQVLESALDSGDAPAP
jgi:murein L,D-transpeptidase YcbB/YkuD